MTAPLCLLSVIGMLIAAGVTVANVSLRYLLSSGISGLNEIIAMSFAVAVAAAIPAGVARGVGIRVDLMEEALPPWLIGWLRVLGNLLLLIFLGLLAYRIYIYTGRLHAENRVTVVLQLPQSPFLFAASGLLAFATLVQAFMTLSSLLAALAHPVGRRPGWAGLAALVIVLLFLALAVYGYTSFDSLSRFARAHPVMTVFAVLLLMWLALLVLVPLAAVMGVLGIVACSAFIGFNPALSAAATEAVGFLTSYQVASLPLFLLMGSFAVVSGVSKDLYQLANALFGRFRGGLAMATIGGSGGFGAVTGSSLATVVTFGRVALPQMRAHNYHPGFAAGCVAAGGTLGALIPPSAPLIVYALLTETSIGQLFAAALIPGILALLLYLVTVAIVVRLRPGTAPAVNEPQRGSVLLALRNCSGVFVLFGSVIGGMYSGLFTATEAAAVGAFVAFGIALWRGKLKPALFWSVMVETTMSIVMIYMLLFSVLAFSFFVAVSGLPAMATAFISGLDVPPIAIIFLILCIFVLMGCIMDSMSVMIITVPIVAPIIVFLGYDLIWWGIINLVIVEIGLITPPFGLHLFVLKSLDERLNLRAIYRGILPFCLADLLRLTLLVGFPIIALWLPMSMSG